jgi:hypothetical protein
MAARKTIDDKLAEIEALAHASDTDSARAGLAAALADRHHRVVAAAARLAAEGLHYALVPDLIAAFGRFLDKPEKSDPNCHAKRAVVRALLELDCDDAGFFIEALKYTQHEPVWGGRADTAVDVRAGAAMGLVGSGYPRALAEVAVLLGDPESPARIGAARAIACGNPREAELLLRAKAVFGDADGQVLGECFTGLLAVEPDESPAFVAQFLASGDDSIRELAALALGESHAEGAVDYLRAAWDDVLVAPELKRALIRAAALHRSDAAFDWLISLIGAGDARTAASVVEALAVYRHNKTLAERLRDVLDERADVKLSEQFAELWER